MQYLVAVILLLVLVVDILSALIGRWLSSARDRRTRLDDHTAAAAKKPVS